MHTSDDKVIELAKTEKGQHDYLKNKCYGHNSSQMAYFFSQKLADSVYETLLKDIQPKKYHETRIYETILRSNNTPQEWIEKFLEIYSNEQIYLFDENIFKPSEHKKLRKTYAYNAKSRAVLSQNISKESFDKLKEEGIISVIQNTKYMSNAEVIEYIKKLNENKLSKSKFQEIISNTVSRVDKDQTIIDFILNNGSFTQIDGIFYYKETFKENQELFDYAVKKIIESDTISAQNKGRIIGNLINEVKKEEYKFSQKNEDFIKKEYAKVWNKAFKVNTKPKSYKFKI